MIVLCRCVSTRVRMLGSRCSPISPLRCPVSTAPDAPLAVLLRVVRPAPCARYEAPSTLGLFSRCLTASQAQSLSRFHFGPRPPLPLTLRLSRRSTDQTAFLTSLRCSCLLPLSLTYLPFSRFLLSSHFSSSFLLSSSSLSLILAMSAPKLGILVRLTAKAGKAAELESFLTSGLAIAQSEPQTLQWYAFKIDDTHFGIYDTFAAQDGRQAHLSGDLAKALFSKVDELMAGPPEVSMLDLLGAKV